MVKVTGGGRGMKAIAAHLRYISKNVRLEIEDDEGRFARGKDALREIADEWRYGGGLIPEVSHRREAFNIMLSMPRGSAEAAIVVRALGHNPNKLVAVQREHTKVLPGLEGLSEED
jgi:hypothetical protein